MRIESLNLSGFKNFEINTKINFQDEHSNFIFDTEEETKIFLFDTILAVLFGIPSGEKPLFKSEDPACKIFTGMLTMDFGGREFLIERDFETDFVAGIFFNSSGSKKPEPFFQGKDYVHSGTSRPFLTALRQYFEFCEKDAIRDICLRNPENENRTLAEILDIFYLLLNPGMKTLRIKNALDLFTPALSMMSDPGQQAPIPERIDYLRWIQASLIDLLKINNRSDQLVLDIRILDQLIKTVNNLISELETLTHTCREKYPDLIDQDAQKLRADILFWKRKNETKVRKDIQLRNINSRVQKLESQMQHSYSLYGSVHKEFEDDIERYQGLKSELVLRKGLIEEHQKNIRLKQKLLLSRQKKKWFILFPVPVVTFIISYYFFGNAWELLIPETVLVTLTLVFYFGLSNKSITDAIFRLNEENRILEHRKKEISKEVRMLFRSSELFSDEEYLVNHLEHINKYHNLQKELNVLKAEQESLQEILSSEEYATELEKFSTEYSQLFALSPHDLEEFLNNFVNLQEKCKRTRQKIEYYPDPERLRGIRDDLQGSLDTLQALQNNIEEMIVTDGISHDELLDQTSRKIKNLEMELRLQIRQKKAS